MLDLVTLFAATAVELAWEILWSPWLVAATYVLALLSIPSVLLARRGRPQAALSWLLLLLLLPVLGLFLWWAIGRKHLVRRRRKRRQAAEQISRRLTELQTELPTPPHADWGLMPIKRLPAEEAEWVFPPTTSNRVHLLVDSNEAYPAVEKMIRDATDHVHVLFYIWEADDTGRRFRDLLIDKARGGVEVRVLLDAVGSQGASGRFMDPLRAAGGEVVAFMPPVVFRRSLELNFRNHRKLVLVDGRRAIIGGLNIGDEYLHGWHDSALQLEGPVVDQLQEVFTDDWHFAKGKEFELAEHFGRWAKFDEEGTGYAPAVCGVVASGPHTELNMMHEAFFMAINAATQRIWLTTPYFIPDLTILAALRTAVFRGVDVRLLVPEQSDNRLVKMASRSYYPELLRSGVRIFEYADGILHAKTAVLDDDMSIVGSANVDIRSFRLNFELNCIVKNVALARRLAELFEQDMGHSREVTCESLERSSYVSRLCEAAAHLMSPLL